MKAITSIFESILRDNSDLVWSPDTVDATAGGACQAGTWNWNPAV